MIEKPLLVAIEIEAKTNGIKLVENYYFPQSIMTNVPFMLVNEGGICTARPLLDPLFTLSDPLLFSLCCSQEKALSQESLICLGALGV